MDLSFIHILNHSNKILLRGTNFLHELLRDNDETTINLDLFPKSHSSYQVTWFLMDESVGIFTWNHKTLFLLTEQIPITLVRIRHPKTTDDSFKDLGIHYFDPPISPWLLHFPLLSSVLARLLVWPWLTCSVMKSLKLQTFHSSGCHARLVWHRAIQHIVNYTTFWMIGWVGIRSTTNNKWCFKIIFRPVGIILYRFWAHKFLHFVKKRTKQFHLSTCEKRHRNKNSPKE